MKVINSNESLIQPIDRPFIQNDFIRIKNLEINKAKFDEENGGCKNKDAEVAIIVGRQNDVGTAKKITKILDRLKITYDLKVVCPIRSNKKFIDYVKSMKNAKVFIGVSSNSSQVTGGIVGLTARPVIGVPCTNENGDNYMLTTVSMPPGVPVATVGINNGRNAAVLTGEIFAIDNPDMVDLLDKLKDKKITF
jgi:5-(carboxyamino)imidazole ribonucleotide mutase